MRGRNILIVLSILLITASGLYAGDTKRIGTAGAQELRIPVGSRSTAMSGANIADVYGAEALFWNPAGVAFQEGTEAMFSHLEYFADINVNYFGVTTNLEEFGSLGVQAKVVSIGEIEITTDNASQGTGETFNPTLSVVGVTYSRIFTDRVSFGFSANLVNERIDLVSATGLSMDFGFIYNTLWNGLKLGIAVKNYGPNMTFGGEGFNVQVPVPGTQEGSAPKTVRTQSAEFELPAFIQFGASYDLFNRDYHRTILVGAFQANSFSEDEFRGGIEYGYNETFFLRGGYVGSAQDDYMYGVSLGGGVKYKWGNSSIALDYSWVQSEFFDDNQYFTAKFSF